MLHDDLTLIVGLVNQGVKLKYFGLKENPFVRQYKT